MTPSTVAIFYNVPDALMLKSFLESRQIICFLADDHFLSIHPMAVHAVGGIKLKVHPDYFERAMLLIQEFSKGRPENPGTEIPICPKCGSDCVLPLPPEPTIYYNEYQCFDCDFEWDDRVLKNINPGHIE